MLFFELERFAEDFAGPETSSCCPGMMISRFNPFRAMSAFGVVPYRLAIPQSDSPFYTTCTREDREPEYRSMSGSGALVAAASTAGEGMISFWPGTSFHVFFERSIERL